MRKYLIQILLVIFVLSAITACDKDVGPSPKEVLNGYLNAPLNGRYEEAYGYVSSADKTVKSMKEYLAENEEKDNPFIKVLTSNVTFDILNVTITGEKATAEVNMTLPDFGVIFRDIMGEVLRSGFDSENQEEIKQVLAKKYADGKLPLTTKKDSYHLIKEQEGWKIFLDWKTEKLEKEKQEKIKALLEEAEEFKNSKKLHGALDKFEQVLEIDGSVVEAKEGIKETRDAIKSFEDKQAYIENVMLYDLKAGNYSTYLDEKIPGVEFKLKNKGSRTLKKVEVTVYFKDATGAIIAEATYHPILVSEYSLLNDNKPLKPNYIWQLERGHFYKADSVPSEWKPGAVSAKITNIEFDE